MKMAIIGILILIIAAGCAFLHASFFNDRRKDPKNKTNEDAETIFGLLWSFLVPAGVFCFTQGIHLQASYNITLFLLCLLGFRKVIQLLTIWWVAYACGFNSSLANKIRPYLMTQPIDKNESAKENKFVKFCINALFWVIGFAVGSLAVCWDWLSETRISFWMHGLTTLPGKFGGFGFFIWVILLLAFAIALFVLGMRMWRGFKIWLNISDKSEDEAGGEAEATEDEEEEEFVFPTMPLIVFLAVFFGRKVYSYAFLGYGGYLILNDLLFWSVFIIAILALAWGIRAIVNLLNRR